MGDKPSTKKKPTSPPKKEPEISSTEDENSPSETPSTKEIDVYDGNWKQYVGPIFYNKSKKIWYCTKCKELMDNPKSSYAHAVNSHSLDATKPEESEPILHNREIVQDGPHGNSLVKDSSYYQRLADDGRSDISSGQVDEELIASVYNLDRQKMSKAAALIASDPYVLFIFTEMKKKKYISPYMSFGDYVRYCIQLHVDFMKIEYKFAINEAALAKSPDRAQMLANIAKEWEEFEKEHGKMVQIID